MARILNAFECSTIKLKKIWRNSSIFTLIDLFLVVFSIISYFIDIGTDIIVIMQYYRNDHNMWMILTASLVCIPSLIVQIFSLRWFLMDGKITPLVYVIHILQFGLFYRFFKLLKEVFNIQKTKSLSSLEKFNHQQNDICMLRLFESFTESAPQLVLQLYIMVSSDQWNPWTGVSAIASVVSLSWGVSAYSKAMRNVRPEKKHLSWWGLLFQALWRVGMVSSRIMAMVLFAAAYGFWIIVALSFHWFSMTIWVIFQETDFCATWWEERLYNCVVGVIYCFCFFNLKEGQSRYRLGIFYSLTVLQNIAFVFAYYLSERSKEGFNRFLTLFVPGGMLLGLSSMLLYYRFFHPSSPITFYPNSTRHFQEDLQNGKPIDKINEKNDSSTCFEEMNVEQLLVIQLKLKEENKNNLSHFEQISSDRTKSCSSNIYRSHSFNCSHNEPNEFTFESLNISRKKPLATHHQNINYNFRSSAAFGTLSSDTHCSCLVLTQNHLQTTSGHSAEKETLSNSLPNLNLSHSAPDTIILQPLDINDSRKCENNIDIEYIDASMIEDDVEFSPIIEDRHIIRIDVSETNHVVTVNVENTS